MKTMYEYLNLIRERRALFGIYTARDIYQFINGFDLAIGVNQINDPTVLHFKNFANWLRLKEPKLSNFNWIGIIEIYSTSISSFEKFFNSFDEFLRENPLK
jgi:hypothetical protein